MFVENTLEKGLGRDLKGYIYVFVITHRKLGGCIRKDYQIMQLLRSFHRSRVRQQTRRLKGKDVICVGKNWMKYSEERDKNANRLGWAETAIVRKGQGKVGV